jgi:RNA recognition motif-containing protein
VNKKLYVGNLEYSTTNEELGKLFSSEGSVISAKVVRMLDGKSKGFGFVEMDTEEEASRAIEKYNQSSFKDRTIFVNEARPQIITSSSENRGGYKRGIKLQDGLKSKLRRLRKRF